MFETPRMSPGAIQMLQTNRGTPVQPVQQPQQQFSQLDPQTQATIDALRKQYDQQQWIANMPGTG